MNRGKYVYKCVLFMDSGNNPVVVRMEDESPAAEDIAKKIIAGKQKDSFNGFSEFGRNRQVFVNIGKIESINIERVNFIQ